MVLKLMICCTNTACNKEAAISDPYSPESKSLNARAIMGMRDIGRGRSGLESFCGVMDMVPPVLPLSYQQHNEEIAGHSVKVALDNMLAASAHLHQLHDMETTDLLDISMTCDGTWSKRGFTATHGVVVVIAWESGQVLDYVIKSKRCTRCTQQKEKLGEGSAEFLEWFEGHQATCECNHVGSSPAMECAGATEFFFRSKEKLHLRYTEVICDGDSKTLNHLNNIKPYGEEVTIAKHECVGHVQKCMGKRLRAVKVVSNSVTIVIFYFTFYFFIR